MLENMSNLLDELKWDCCMILRKYIKKYIKFDCNQFKEDDFFRYLVTLKSCQNICYLNLHG